jgi:hypothetical protein
MAVLLPAAADQLGVEMPVWPEFNRRDFKGDEIETEQAAKGLGLSKDDYVAKVLREANASVLAKLQGPTVSVMPSPVSSRAPEPPPQRIAAGSSTRRK